MCRLRLPRRAPRNVAHESTVTRSQSAASANAISNLPGSRLPITEPAQKAGTADCRIHATIGSNSHCERPKLCGCSRALHRDSIVTAVMEGGKRAFELALTGTDSRKVMIATVESGRVLQSVGFFTTCSGGLFLSFCCFFLSSSFVLDFLQSEIVLEGIHPCNVHELPNGKFRLGNLCRLL